LKKKYDPLWEIVEEKVSLQGSEDTKPVKCPWCHVSVDLPGQVRPGERFLCGLCGAICEVTPGSLVADDGSAEVTAHLAE
jgi:hypothetical protein